MDRVETNHMRYSFYGGDMRVLVVFCCIKYVCTQKDKRERER